MDEIQKLVEEYNIAETLQLEKLQRLYRIFRDRRGYREVCFNGDKWGVNQFQPSPESVGMERAMEGLATFILSYQAGEPGDGNRKDETGVNRYVNMPKVHSARNSR